MSADRLPRLTPDDVFETIGHAKARAIERVTHAAERARQADADLADAVTAARRAGVAWRSLGVVLGLTAQGVRWRYAVPQAERDSP